MEQLKQSEVHKNLDSKTKIMGLEIFDLIGLLIFAATMNLMFGKTPLAFVMVIALPTILSVALYWGKRGKPDGFLLHLIRFHLLPGTFESGEASKNNERLKEYIFE